MERRSQVRNEALVAAELFAFGKLHAILIVDITTEGVSIEVPDFVSLEFGDTVLIRLVGLASAVAHVRWCRNGQAGLIFRHPLHPSVLDFTLHDYKGGQIIVAPAKSRPQTPGAAIA